MRILWVKLGGLWPINVGERIRSFHMVSELSRSNRVTVLTTHGSTDDPHELGKHLPHCERVISIPHDVSKRGSIGFICSLVRSWPTPYAVNLWRRRVPALRAEVQRLLDGGAIDICVADFLFAMPNIPARTPVPVVLFEHNVEYVIWKRQSEVETRWWRRALLEFEWRKIRRYESSACARAQLTLTVSDVDRALLAQQVPHAAIRSIRTGVDTSYFAPNGTAEKPSTLVFTGAMDWYPNEDAMLYFIESVFPMIRSRISDVSLSVVGRNPSRRLRQVAERPGVTVTGIVEDIRPYVAQAAVYIVPLRVGGGTRLKIFEACAMGKAVVSTAVGAEGLPLIPGVHFIEANDAEKFALEVVSLLQNPEHRRALGTAARRLVEEQYSWASVGREFDARCKEVLNHAN